MIRSDMPNPDTHIPENTQVLNKGLSNVYSLSAPLRQEYIPQWRTISDRVASMTLDAGRAGPARSNQGVRRGWGGS